jgi:hypothetical protein
MKHKLLIFFLTIFINNNSYADQTILDLSFMIATVSNGSNSFCHGFFIDNHTIILPNNCNNDKISTVKRYTKEINNKSSLSKYHKDNIHILSNNGLLLNNSLITLGTSKIALLSTKKNIYLDTIVKLGGTDKKIIIPALIDGNLIPLNGFLKKSEIHLSNNQNIKNCLIIAGTPILTNKNNILTNKNNLSVIDFFDSTIPCEKILNYKINNNLSIEKTHNLINCFTKFNGFTDIYKNKALCNFRYST